MVDLRPQTVESFVNNTRLTVLLTPIYGGQAGGEGEVRGVREFREMRGSNGNGQEEDLEETG